MKELNVGTVYSFKMNNRDEIIAKVTKNDDDCVWVDKPVFLLITQEGPQMPPIMLTTEEEVYPLSWNSIMTYAKTKDDAEAHYRKVTTGIVTPNKQIITG